MSNTSIKTAWDKTALVAKAVVFFEKMEASDRTDFAYGLWSALALELIARAALANISPVLLADGANFRNITFALGMDPTSKKFLPKSIGTSEVLDRLKELDRDITEEIVNFCRVHINKRNSELHTGEFMFQDESITSWAPNYFHALTALLVSMDCSLEDVPVDQEFAYEMLGVFKDETAKTVNKDIAAYKLTWGQKSDAQRTELVSNARIWVEQNQHSGHGAQCPACEAPIILVGSPSGAVETIIAEDGDILEKQTMLPRSFECTACGLRVSGLSKLTQCGLGNPFQSKSLYVPAEYYGLFTEDDIEEARNDVPGYYQEYCNE